MNNDQLLTTVLQNFPSIFEKLKSSHFERYAYLIHNLKSTNVIANAAFQKKFNGLYRVRFRQTDWKKVYYVWMEKMKTNPNPSFEETMNHLYQQTGKIEPSFSSKLVAIINPDAPVYDSVVASHLGLIAPRQYLPDHERIQAFAELYTSLSNQMNRLIEQPDFPKLSRALDAQFPQFAPDLTSMRKLDLLLWQFRPNRSF
jgi:hypothetical protein